jgi:hypothetical protein
VAVQTGNNKNYELKALTRLSAQERSISTSTGIFTQDLTVTVSLASLLYKLTEQYVQVCALIP